MIVGIPMNQGALLYSWAIHEYSSAKPARRVPSATVVTKGPCLAPRLSH